MCGEGEKAHPLRPQGEGWLTQNKAMKDAAEPHKTDLVDWIAVYV